MNSADESHAGRVEENVLGVGDRLVDDGIAEHDHAQPAPGRAIALAEHHDAAAGAPARRSEIDVARHELGRDPGRQQHAKFLLRPASQQVRDRTELGSGRERRVARLLGQLRLHAAREID